MNIVIATGIFPPDIGGPATYSKSLAEEFFARGHRVTVVTYSDAAPSRHDPRYTLRCIPRFIPKGLRHMVYAYYIVRSSISADVMYAQDPVSAGVPVYIASLIIRKKFILKVVGDYAWEQSIQRFGVTDLLDNFLVKKYGFRIQMLRWIQSLVARKACRVIVPSMYLKSVVQTWGVSEDYIAVVYNAVHVPDIPYTKEEAKKELNLKGTILLSIGRLVPWKGFRMLIELMPTLVAQKNDIRLIIAGDGPDREELQKRVYDINMREYITFLGAVPKEKLMRYILSADIFLLNTGYEGFSHQLLEVLTIPIPIITTTAGGNKEIMQSEDEADFLAVEYNNADAWERVIMRVLGDASLYAQLSRHTGYDNHIYTTDDMVAKTLQVFYDA
ncbi:MAG: hypothetical protein COU90_01875 [Candidatus Ryanbacteria bacterium CG10_big_fil_rev_8_21_14_0_10_43_42]|uniref:Glycosyltransferase family 1 protein n=1 Tax=Candidatus Ryanbacteria bacterium CG10_big_fil_rev_8_21_14_0_10_43_42 TaxID=1974864 RepID=A0A2M8KXE4_9BACT|nr:MAG: hypothetical protein COU90_01875 [Candidatus Ryanbacteria bacterium CG10_big_fil_rev_8_21_14_0_10_43_42]